MQSGGDNYGKLYVVATPIGNLEDMTIRAVRVLKEVGLIAAEDTRHTRKLLAHYGISTPLTSYHEHNEVGKSAHLVEKIKQGGDLALVTDAGMVNGKHVWLHHLNALYAYQPLFMRY